MTDIKCTHVEKYHTNIIEMKGALCARIVYYIRRRQQIFTVDLLNLSYGYRSKGTFNWTPVLEQVHIHVKVSNLLPAVYPVHIGRTGKNRWWYATSLLLVLDPMVNPSHRRSINIAQKLQLSYNLFASSTTDLWGWFLQHLVGFSRFSCVAATDCRWLSGQGWQQRPGLYYFCECHMEVHATHHCSPTMRYRRFGAWCELKMA